VIHFAYPNGHLEDYDKRSIDTLDRLGYRTAVTTLDGVNPERLDRFQLMRIGISDPKYVIAFELLGIVSWFRNRKSKRMYAQVLEGRA